MEIDPTRNLLLDIVNQKSLFGLDTAFGGDCVNQEEIHEIDIPDIECGADRHPAPDHSYSLSMEASSCMVTDKENQSVKLKECPSKELQHNWTTRRRPKVQQLPSSKLAEEYLELAKVKIDLFTKEKESLVNRERREEELLNLKKRKLQLDIRLTEMELSAKTVTKLPDT
nr:unnamed protein product [Callosobruchus chinensis]